MRLPRPCCYGWAKVETPYGEVHRIGKDTSPLYLLGYKDAEVELSREDLQPVEFFGKAARGDERSRN